MQLQAQHTLAEVIAAVESQDKTVPAKYTANADTPANKKAMQSEKDFHKALGTFIKTLTKGYKGAPNAGLVLDYDVTPSSVRVVLQFSATESRDVVNQGPPKKKRSKPKAKPAVSSTPKPKPTPPSSPVV